MIKRRVTHGLNLLTITYDSVRRANPTYKSRNFKGGSEKYRYRPLDEESDGESYKGC
jgi:hypothetical protein